jgi:hypothetical protein
MKKTSETNQDIYACLNKPVDPDELHYWIKCIFENDKDPV